jgi:hypothetical protein
MDARVGARLEVVTPRRVVTPADIGYLVLLLAASVGLHAWIVARAEVTARDGLEFARIALNLQNARVTPPADGDARRSVPEVLKASVQPPGYPAAILAAWQFLKTDADVPTNILRAAQIASAIAAALTVFPTYWLGRMLFSSKFIGFAGALIFQTLPAIAHLTSDALSESLYLLLGSTALLFGVRGLRRRSVGMFLLCGFACGMAYLVRPEGVMVLLAVGLTIAAAGVFRTWTRTEAVGRLVALGIGFSAVAVPYMTAINGFSNKTTFKEMRDRWMGTTPAKPLWQGDQGRLALPRPALFADFHAGGNKIGWAASAILKETTKSAHYVVFFLGLAGVLAHRRRVVADPGLGLLVVLAGINLCVLAALAIKVGYVSERHTVVLVLLLSLFAASALEPVWQFVGVVSKAGPRALLVAIVASSLPAALKTPHETRLGHPHAGRYLAAHVQPDDAVIDPFCWAEWYAGRTLLAVPDDPQPPKARWVVLETGKSPHSRLPRYEGALNVVNDGKNVAKLMFWWPAMPEAEAREKAKVLVFRQEGDGK